MKFSGLVGFVTTKEIRPSVWDYEVIEKPFRGEINKMASRWNQTSYKNDDVVIAQTISIVMDPWTNEHFHQIKFVVWKGAAIQVSNITVEYPRLTLELGGVYNGQRATK